MALTNRERFLRLMRGEPVDRAPFAACFLAWDETLARWHAEGLPREASARVDFLDVVGVDFYVHRHKAPIHAFMWPGIERRVLEEEGDTRVLIDAFGARQRVHKNATGMPEFLEFPVADRADWDAIRWRFDPATPGRLPEQGPWRDFCAASEQLTDPCYAGGLPSGFFGGLRQLLGLERLAMAFHDDPVLIEDMLDTLCDLWVDLYPRAFNEARVDMFIVWEDMCYRNGPMLSPEMFRRFLVPRYRRLTAAVREAGVDIIMVDTDGDPRLLIDAWLEGGVTGLYPWETQMGLDITQVRRAHPTLQMMGGIDKGRLAFGRQSIDQELRKVPFMLESGRYLPCLDHSVPPNVAWDDYCYFSDQLRRLIERHPPTGASS